MFSDIQSLNACLEQSRTVPVLLFKHSATCPISFYAKEQIESFLRDYPIVTYMLVVQEDRPLSNQIANDLQITHQSPQAIWLRDAEVVKVLNHYSITEEALEALVDTTK